MNSSSTATFKKPREKVKKITTTDSSSNSADQGKKQKEKGEEEENEKESGGKEGDRKEGSKPCEGKVTGTCSFEMSQEKIFVESRVNSLLADEPRCLELFVIDDKKARSVFEKAKIDIIKKNETFREKKEILNEQNEPEEYILNYFAMEIDVKLQETEEEVFRTSMFCVIKNKIE